MKSSSPTIFITLILYLSLISLCSTLKEPILLKAHDRVYFDLVPQSNYVIYAFENDMPDDSYDLVVRLFNWPSYSVMIYVFYSEEDVSKDLDSLIKYDEATDTFSGYFYSCTIKSLSDRLYELVLNKDTTNGLSPYLKPGYIYTIIHLTDKSAKAEHYDWFYIYNTYKPSVLFQKKIEYFGTETLADYFLIGSHYLRYKTYYIPELSKNELLKYNYAISYYPYMYYSDKADIKIYKNEISADPYHTDSYSFLGESEAENIIELEAGFSYYILITHSVINYYHYREEIMFQLIPAKVQRIYEGNPVALTTFGYRYLFFYLDVTMFDDEYFYFKIYTSGDELRDLIPKELESNNYDYIVS